MLYNKEAQDIFKRLSVGCFFNKNREDKARAQKRHLDVDKVAVKQEKLDDEANGKEKVEDNITLLSSMRQDAQEPKRKKKKVMDEEKIQDLEQEKVNQYRNINDISVVGRHIPAPIKSFEDIGLRKELLKNLSLCGFSDPTSIQKQGIPVMMAGRQMLACAPTGSGKTLAFLVPIIHALKEPKRDGFRALILCPTRELAKQIQKLCIRLTDGMGFHVHIMSRVNKAIQQYGPKSSGNYDILITTPNRLCFLLKQEPPAIDLSKIEWLVADEADKYFEESSTKGFFDQFKLILAACSAKNRKIAMFGATYTPAVAKWCVHNLRGLIRVTVGHRNSAVDLVDQSLKFVGSEDGKLIEIRNIIRDGFRPPVLIFVQSKERAQQLHQELFYDNINIDAIHADRTQDERDAAIRDFREGKTWVLICTEILARGIDFKAVNLVINYDFPQTAISYIHRVGRAGRAGRRGKAITFFTLDDMEYVRPIAHVIKESGGEVADFIFTLKKPSKKTKKKLKVSAPKRVQISTTPVYDKILKRKKMKLIKNSKKQNKDADNNGNVDETTPGRGVRLLKNDQITKKRKAKNAQKAENNSVKSKKNKDVRKNHSKVQKNVNKINHKVNVNKVKKSKIKNKG